MISIYPGALWIPAHPARFRAAGRSSFDEVVIHCTDGHGDAHGTAEMWRSRPEPGKASSAHFVIGQDATIIQAVSLADIAEHAHSRNRTSAGIEHCCRTPKELGPDDLGLKPTEDQLRASARLTVWLASQGPFELSRLTVRGHAEADPTTSHRGCPTSAGIDLDAYMGLVYALVGAPFA